MNEPRQVWEGTLAIGGRAAEEFQASIVVDDAEQPHILRKIGVAVTEVSPHQIRGEYWLAALAATHAPPTKAINGGEDRARLQRYKENLRDWREPDGYLVPTEPDEHERAKVRAGLKGAIFELTWALDGEAAARAWQASNG